MPAFVIAAPRKIVINFEGTDYDCRMPVLGEQIAYEENIAKARKEKTGVLKHIRDFVMASGLPKEVVEKLDGDQLDAVTVALQPPKKKLSS